MNLLPENQKTPTAKRLVSRQKSRMRAWIDRRAFILSYLGSLLMVMGILMFIPLIPLEIYDEWGVHAISCWTFILPGLLSVVIGLLLQKGISLKTPSVSDAMVITALGWILVGVLGAIPFMLGIHKSFIDAFFESVSGFTTTGITVFEGLDTMPRSILFWRSFTQWIGGLGILTFFLFVSFRGGSAAACLFGAEGHKIGTSRPVPGIFHTVKVLWLIYTVFTIGSILAFLLGGMSGFDALNHSLTCISTGGFSTHDQSIGYYAAHHFAHASFLEYTVIFFMLAGGTNFLVHYKVATGKIRVLVRDFEMRWYGFMIGMATCLVVIDHFFHFPLMGRPLFETLRSVFRICLFQIASIITSTGFATRDIGAPFFPALSKQIFLMLMVVGGCVGSTAGGIKILRFGILIKMFRTQIYRIVAPRKAVAPIVVQGQIIPKEEIERIGALFSSWLVLIGLGALITAFFSDLNAWQSFSGMASAMGNMGPFYFTVHKMASLNWIVKATFIFGMLAGRLEILPVAVILSRSTWR